MNLKTVNAELVVDIQCKVAWRCPAQTQEEQAQREAADRALALIAHDMNEAVGHMILAVVKIKSEGLINK